MLIMINNYTKLKCVKSTKNNNDKHLKIIKKNYILYFNLVDIYKILINLIFILFYNNNNNAILIINCFLKFYLRFPTKNLKYLKLVYIKNIF